MNVEQLDGFFSVLIVGPKTVMSSEYNREVFGGEMSEACVRQSRRSQKLAVRRHDRHEYAETPGRLAAL